jgi:DNA-3-methyladenine glycosylase II
MDVWDGRYRRGLLLDEEPATIDIEQTDGPERPRLRATLGMATPITEVRRSLATGAVESLLSLRVDLGAFYDVADRDPRLAPVKDRFLGLHPPRFPTLFEALANAIANQQLSLEVRLGLLNRLSDAYGSPAPGTEGLSTFPSAEVIATTELAPLREMASASARRST